MTSTTLADENPAVLSGEQPAMGDGAVMPAVAPAAPATEAPVNAEAADGNLALAGLVALLGLVALGGAGFMMMRRRRPANDAEAEVATAAAEPAEGNVMEPAAPVHVPPASVAPSRTPEAPVYRRPEPVARPATSASPAMSSGMGGEYTETPTSPFVSNPFYKGKAPEERPVFVMPAGPVPTGERRDALLHRMVAARPDADNPYTSTKRRLRRARALLNERERALREQAVRPFDFRDFDTHVPIRPYRPADKPPVPHMA